MSMQSKFQCEMCLNLRPEHRKMSHLSQHIVVLLVMSWLFILGNATGAPIPLGKSKIQAEHINSQSRLPHFHTSKRGSRKENGFSLSEFIRRYLPVIPNTYYDVPKHRYPYYDENGTGRLLYGYGGKTLYKYTVFKPLEGYFK